MKGFSDTAGTWLLDFDSRQGGLQLLRRHNGRSEGALGGRRELSEWLMLSLMFTM
jgi:hypothetical protein